MQIVGIQSIGTLKSFSDDRNVSASAREYFAITAINIILVLSQIPTTQEDIVYHNDRNAFPPNVTDINSEQVDMRSTTSWKLNLDEVSEIEMIEAQTVNTSAPFVLCSRLREMMKRNKDVSLLVFHSLNFTRLTSILSMSVQWKDNFIKITNRLRIHILTCQKQLSI